MRSLLRCTIIWILPVWTVAGIQFLAADEATKEIDFARVILPILSDKCFVCHGPDGHAQSGDEDFLRLDSFNAATVDRGGYRAIDPDVPEKSQILERIHSTDDPMPPADAEKQLNSTERDLLSRWIREGGRYAMHWAFVPPRRTLPPAFDALASNNPIDAFIQQRLKQQGLALAPEADRAVLARRVSLVLTGLPPEPAVLSLFLADSRADAYERFVDALLNSPQYGEHQARYWLDAVRYGDTHGLHLDNRRGIYPYRDWVIQAFNKNLPLDQFIVWQLAGDLLPDPTLEQQVATGFVRMNPSTAEGGAIPEEFQAKNNFDRVETLGTVFLGMSLTCARCHIHKYDPILQTEYYELLAFFNNTAEPSMDGNKYEYGPVVRAPDQVATWGPWNRLEAERSKLLQDATVSIGSQEDIDATVLQKWESENSFGRFTMLVDPQGPLTTLEVHQKAVELSQRMAELEQTFTTTLVAEELAAPRVTRLLQRGEYDLPTGEPLQPGVIAVMGALPQDAPRNRLGLAQWLTSREHPLVARVLINRFWQQTFGHGLVRTPEDFGLQGQQATHPELLDWLAVELLENQWDLRHLLRLMVTSRTFRQSSAWRSDMVDPDNRLLARGPAFRLDAEVIRDISLWASGLLDPRMGGEGVKPYQPAGLWEALMHPASNTRNYVQDQGQKLYRRSLYVYWKRTSPHPMMTLFDAPSRESSCVRRSRSNTSLQSLALLNETQRVEMSRLLAERLLRESADEAARMDFLFMLAASRTPTDREREACTKLLHSMRSRYKETPDEAVALLSTGEAARDESLETAELAAWSQLASTVLASDIVIAVY